MINVNRCLKQYWYILFEIYAAGERERESVCVREREREREHALKAVTSGTHNVYFDLFCLNLIFYLSDK